MKRAVRNCTPVAFPVQRRLSTRGFANANKSAPTPVAHAGNPQTLSKRRCAASLRVAMPLANANSVSPRGDASAKGEDRVHWCQLNVKTSLGKSFRDCLVKSLCLGMPNERLCLKTSGKAAIEEYFQPETGNEVLKGFGLKLTPMNHAGSPTHWLVYTRQNPPPWVSSPEFFLSPRRLTTLREGFDYLCIAKPVRWSRSEPPSASQSGSVKIPPPTATPLKRG
ncbi:hypothetical protein PQG02_10995 [Nostoc sp. UHCC 0926]|uniref:hypothetical protein n=1 Tax=unclassified Nostoc TaxID=2593658 RepID=UPI002360F302|nr:hypothetical protein [Nostoc sp. UHCC 0926]WDD34800.1 hypothetical protein PQG02_10995 [Nostoc sp. UHCC 0926]